MDDLITAEEILDNAAMLAPGAKLICKLTNSTAACAISSVLSRVAALDEETRNQVADWLRYIPLIGAAAGEASIQPEPKLPSDLSDIEEDLATLRDCYRGNASE